MIQYENELWANTLDWFESRISRSSFDTWFKETKARLEGNTLLIIAYNEFGRDWLECQYLRDIKEVINQRFNLPYEVKIIVEEKEKENIHSDSQINNILKKIDLLPESEKTELFLQLELRYGEKTEPIKLNQKYTFENFIKHTGNKFSLVAAHSIVEALGNVYNPLVIHGPTEGGKTHLLHAIGNAVMDRNQSAKVIFVHAEQFVNEFLDSISKNTTRDFTNKYRSADVLLFDDFQYLSGKEQSQEEFFHLFNALFEESKQIVIASAYPPKELRGILDRLLARLSWGLVTEIRPENGETVQNPFSNGDKDKLGELEQELKRMKDHFNKLETQVQQLLAK